MPKHERLSRGWVKIGELAKKLSMPVTTIRYYTDIGLLPVIAETEGGYRLYDVHIAMERLDQIRQLSGSHPTLKQAKEIIDQRCAAI